MTDEHLPPSDRPVGSSGDSASSFDDNPRTRPGIGDVLVWGLLGCGALVMLTCGIGGIGGLAWFVTMRPPQVAPPVVPVVVESDEPATDTEKEGAPPPGSLPELPLKLLAPLPPASNIRNTDLTKLDPRALRATAHQLYEKGQFRLALQCQYQSVVKEQVGQYDLACFYSLIGDVPESALLAAGCRQGRRRRRRSRLSRLGPRRRAKRSALAEASHLLAGLPALLGIFGVFRNVARTPAEC